MSDLISRFKVRSDLHQSPMYQNLMHEIGWQVERHGDSQLYYRSLGPLTIAKIQRPKSLDQIWFKEFRKNHKTLTTFIEPGLSSVMPEKSMGFFVEPFAHSSTSLIDLNLSEVELLTSFTQKTRYNITHTLKKAELRVETTKLGKLTKKQLADFFELHNSWSKQKNVIGYSVKLLNSIIKSFAKSGDLHLTYKGLTLVGALLILYHDSVATYWAAFASPGGYKSFAPTLLTWVALQTAKAKQCKIFDFGGIYDPRYPKMYKKWIGFTKFKSGFNPTVISYPRTTLQLFW